MDAVLIRNPISGSPNRQYALALALDEFTRARWRLDVRETAYKGHARLLAEEAAGEGYATIIVAGGDGSIGQVADGILRSGKNDVRMGIIPLGTGNVFARDLGLPYPNSSHDIATVKAARIITQGQAVPLDVGLANDQAFMCWAGCGLDAMVTKRVEADMSFNKRKRPVFTYASVLLPMLRSYVPIPSRVEVDNEVFEGQYLAVVAANISLYARYLRLAPRAYLNDGLLDLFVIDATDLLRFAFIALKTITFPPGRDKRIKRRRFQHLRIESASAQPYHLDGDPLGDTPVAISVLPQRLPVFLNKRRSQPRFM